VQAGVADVGYRGLLRHVVHTHIGR
jgi:hypothetical protein